MNCEECKTELEDTNPDTCGHSGILLWCSIHRRYECEQCHMKDEKQGLLNGREL